MEIRTGYVTDVGRKKNNQDSLIMMSAKTAAGRVTFEAVCDGMGGLEKGELASAVTVKSFEKWFRDELPFILNSDSVAESVFTRWRDLIYSLNEKLTAKGGELGVQLGTTIAGILFIEPNYYIMNVGDSRVYEITDTEINCLTHDQTLVQLEVDQGKLRAEDMERDPRRSVLLQCIGAEGSVEPDFKTGTIRNNSVYLVCSDGFRHVISSQEISEVLRPSDIRGGDDLTKRLQQLVSVDLERGERDNITALAIHLF